ncbi:hypothetical protein, partial [Hydrogenophaga sp. RWCD_12]|uniref:hypothetical protein n=1 Tax=Hydrogenophaga sp. RWCD_12 TaxID=3391190 RepID=UPI003984C7E7
MKINPRTNPTPESWSCNGFCSNVNLEKDVNPASVPGLGAHASLQTARLSSRQTPMKRVLLLPIAPVAEGVRPAMTGNLPASLSLETGKLPGLRSAYFQHGGGHCRNGQRLTGNR